MRSGWKDESGNVLCVRYGNFKSEGSSHLTTLAAVKREIVYLSDCTYIRIIYHKCIYYKRQEAREWVWFSQLAGRVTNDMRTKYCNKLAAIIVFIIPDNVA